MSYTFGNIQYWCSLTFQWLIYQTIITNIPVTYYYDIMIAVDINLLNKVCMTIPVKNRLENKKGMFKNLKQMSMHFKGYV